MANTSKRPASPLHRDPKRTCANQSHADAALQIPPPVQQFWTRTSATDYHLPDEPINDNEALSVQTPDNGVEPQKIIGIYKKFVVEILAEIFDEWTLEAEGNGVEFLKHVHYCTNSYAFQHCFNLHVDRHIRICANRNQKDLGHFVDLQREMQEKIFQKAVFELFLSYACGRNESPNLAVCLKKGKEYREELRKFKNLGLALRKQAIWVGIERASEEETKELEGKYLVEQQDIVDHGLASGMLTDEDKKQKRPNYILLSGKMHRICVPENSQQAYAIIFWTKEGPNDNTPLSRKIFGGVIYNFHKFNKAASMENPHTQAEYKFTEHLIFIRKNSPLNRERLNSQGKMAKSTGVQASYGIPYTMKAPDAVLANNTHIPLKGIEPMLESRQHELLSGFLPEFAEACINAARSAELLNTLGTPKLSNFATYDYSAFSHLDNDETPTSGWVMKRPTSLSSHEKNFVWSSHRLIIELNAQTRWFWDARTEEHGTTISINDVDPDKPKSTPGYIKKQSNAAQWTCVSVLPKAVASAFTRHR